MAKGSPHSDKNSPQSGRRTRCRVVLMQIIVRGCQRMAVENQFRLLVERADKFGKSIGVGKELFLGLLEERSDWAFIIQIDALNETAIRETMARLLRVNGVADDGGDKWRVSLTL